MPPIMHRRDSWKGLVIALVALMTVVCACEGSPHKSDQEMIENFRNKKSAFESLLQMVKEDHAKVGGILFRIDVDWTEPKNLPEFGIYGSRIHKYRAIFQEIGVPRGFYAYPVSEGSPIHFVASTQGGSIKGYAWLTTTPEFLIDGDLDEYRSKGNREYLVYRAIEGNWYLVSSN